VQRLADAAVRSRKSTGVLQALAYATRGRSRALA
jgi:hypothetical protein